MYQMDAKFADEVVECVEMLSGNSVDVSWCSYSGRSMYGARCFAIQVDRGMEFTVGVAMGRVAAEWDERDGTFHFRAVEVVEAMSSGACTDNMGLGMVIYWPSVEPPENSESDDEGDE